jgi:Family of unknown function (DUF5681)
MRFQPGHSGNPAGRPPGSLNKDTLAAQAVLEERAEEMVTNIMDRAKNGDPTAMRLCMERLVPTGRNRPVAIDLPVVKTPDDAQAALAVVTAELAAGTLTISEASALITLIDHMLRLAERMWNFERARRYGARRDAILLDDAEAPEAAAQTPQTAEKPDAPLYSPVNSGLPGAQATAASSGRGAGPTPPAAPREDTPLPRAA